ncbi:histidinol dehydrogenase [Candidatus Peregrinibacteria bacterium]|nr:histidinol dehydrogenase [Candidatus Peregrinibacteria bacterium]
MNSKLLKDPLKIINWKTASNQEKKIIMSRSQLKIEGAREVAREWIAKVEKEGDAALVEYIRKFDDKNFTADRLRVVPKDIAEAYKKVGLEKIKIIQKQIEISREFHARQMPKKWQETNEYISGVITGWKYTPIESAGLTVPAGQVPLPTVMQILTIAAKTACVPRVVACFPPTGKHYEMLVAADIAGADEIYRVGGIAGIAAMSIGTETIKPVLKIVGPGSVYTQAAKMEISQRGTAIDMLSGPSEALIIADDTAKPKYCAADILARCEHDQNACAVLVTNNKKLIEETASEIEKQLQGLGRKEIAEVALGRYCALILFDSMKEMIKFANDYSPEHLEIMAHNPWSICDKIKNAGSIFLGDYAPVAVGDYASGTNHCLPTGVAPKTVSPIGVDTFLKKSEIQYLTKQGLQTLEPIISTMSDIETLDAHKKSVLIRFK